MTLQTFSLLLFTNFYPGLSFNNNQTINNENKYFLKFFNFDQAELRVQI